MDVLHNVCIDVSSENPAPWMTCYIQFMCMDIFCYICNDVSSDLPASWRIYYTHHTYTDDLH